MTRSIVRTIYKLDQIMSSIGINEFRRCKQWHDKRFFAFQQNIFLRLCIQKLKVRQENSTFILILKVRYGRFDRITE